MDGGRVVQETLLWDPDKGRTMSMRSKEEAHDYRYFPDPDLLPLVMDDDWIQQITQSLPELPEPNGKRFIDDYGLPAYDAEVLTIQPRTGGLFRILPGKVIQIPSRSATGSWVPCWRC